jgi:hypothetical protein
MRDALFAKLDTSGTCLWIRTFGGVSNDEGNSISIGPNGEIYFSGDFASTTGSFFGSTPAGLTSNGDGIFVVKYNANGNYQWSESASTTGSFAASYLCTDNSGNVYLGGRYNSQGWSFNTVTFPLPTGYYNVYIIKFSPNGNIIWSSIFELSQGNGVSYGMTMNVATGDLFVLGEFNVQFYVDSVNIMPVQNFNSCNYIIKLDSLGDFKWVKKISGTGSCYQYDLRYASGSIYHVGSLLGSGNLGTFPFNTGTDQDFNLAKITDCNPPDANAYALGPLTLCTGDTLNLITYNIQPGYTYQWQTNGFDNSQTNPSIAVTSTGSYGVVITDATGCSNVSTNIPVIVYPPPVVSLDSANYGSTCFVDSVKLWEQYPQSLTFQWLLNGNPLPGDTAFEYLATTSGIYSVVSSNMFGCTASWGMNVVIGNPVNAQVNVPDSVCNNSAIFLIPASPPGGVRYINGNPSSYFNPSVLGPGVHQVWYIASNTNGCIDTAFASIVVYICNVGMEEISLVEQLISYPNPVTDECNIELPFQDNVELELWSPLGKLCFRRTGITQSTYTFKRNDLAAGLYFISARNMDGRFAIGKLLIQ